MVEFSIVGDENIAASRILVPVAIATVLPGVVVPVSGGGGGGGGYSTVTGTLTIASVLSAVPISGTVVSSPPNYIGTVGGMGTVGTLQSLANLAVASLVGSIGSPIIVGGGTVGTVQSLPNLAVASLVGSIGSPIVVGGGTVGTVQSLPNLAVASLVGSVGSPVTVGGGTVTTQPLYRRVNIATGVTVSASSISTLQCGSLQDLVVDAVFGTVTYGSVQVQVWGVEPQSGVLTSTLLGGSWYGGTVQIGQRLQVAGPIGELAAVLLRTANGGTVGIGTALSVYVSAEQSGSG